MYATNIINFRLPERQYAACRREAQRQMITLSAYLRQCIEEACARAEEKERQQAEWKSTLPTSVRELVGIACPASADGEATRADYREHLEEKYA